jgi:hypothetical protein
VWFVSAEKKSGTSGIVGSSIIRHGVELPGQFREKDGVRIPRL